MPSSWSRVANSATNASRSTAQPLLERAIGGRHRALGRGVGEQGPGGERSGLVDGDAIDLVGRRHPVDEPDRERLGGIHLPPRQDQVAGLREADQAGEPLRSTRAGDDPQFDLGQAEPRILGDAPDVAGKRHLEAATQRESVDRRDRDLRDRLEVAAGLLERPHVRGDLVRPVPDHRLDVGARGEDPLAAPDDDGANGLVSGDASGGLGQLERDGARERVRGRPVDADRGDPALGVDADELPHGRPILADPRRSGRSEGCRCTCNSLLQSPTWDRPRTRHRTST